MAFQQDLEWAIKRPGEPRHPQDDQFTVFGDTVEELSRWYGFSDDYLADRYRGLEPAETDFAEIDPYRNPFRGVGRNDPCPYGSGKKFKNCCLRR
jgi:uncharacterized protein YecA (UPF0149 family)